MNRGEVRKQLSTAERISALSQVGAALMSELDEARLLHLIAETACEVTGAEFAAFSLRPANEEGQPLVPSEGYLFHLAAVVGVTAEQEALFRRMPLGGEGLLAPIFRHGVPVLVEDAFQLISPSKHLHSNHAQDRRARARERASDYAHGQLPPEELRYVGVPRGHPVIRSFLGAPLLDRTRQVRGGLLLGHTEPGQFTTEDEALLVGLAAQAAVALENARLYRTAQMHARELDRIFESIGDGVTLVNHQGRILRENAAARRLREHLKSLPESERASEELLHDPARRALSGEAVTDSKVSVTDGSNDTREYLVMASPLRPPPMSSGPLRLGDESAGPAQDGVSGAVVVWHDVTERRIREAEREARAYASHLEAVFEAMTDGVFVYDRKGNIVQVNSTARMLFAFDAAPDYLSRPLKERLARLVVHDTQGTPPFR